VIVLQGHKDRLDAVQFSPDGTTVAAPTWAGIQLWRPFDGAGGRVVLAPSLFTTKFQFTPDGRTLFTAGGNALRKFDLTSGAMVAMPLGTGSDVYFALASSGDRYVVGRNGFQQAFRMTGYSVDGTTLWDRPVEGFWWVNPLFVPGDEEVIRVVTGPGVSTPESRFIVYSAATGAEVRRSDPIATGVKDWAVSPDGTMVACRVTMWVHVYPLRGPFRGPSATLRNDTRKAFTGLAYHPSGAYLAATSNDTTVKLFETATWALVRTFTWDIGRMRSITFSRDGALAAAGSDKGKVVVWDVDL
jgi:WD40 repeat protein